MDKDEIRQKYLKIRSQMTRDEVASKCRAIRQSLISSVDWRSISTVHIYHSQVALNEVDTTQIIEHFQRDRPNIKFTIGAASPNAPIPLEKYDLIIVPVVSFDAERNRLGFGGGWYDRFLATQPQATTIGLAYDFQQCDAIPTEPHDVPLDKIITNSSII